MGQRAWTLSLLAGIVLTSAGTTGGLLMWLLNHDPHALAVCLACALSWRVTTFFYDAAHRHPRHTWVTVEKIGRVACQGCPCGKTRIRITSKRTP